MITVRRLKFHVGTLVLATHVVAIGIIVANFRRKFGPDFEQFASTLFVLIPFTVFYASAFLKDFVVNMSRDPTDADRPIRSDSYFTIVSIIAVFCAFLIICVLGFVAGILTNLEQFKITLGLTESAFGVFVGIVFEQLFGLGPNRPRQGQTTNP